MVSTTLSDNAKPILFKISHHTPQNGLKAGLTKYRMTQVRLFT